MRATKLKHFNSADNAEAKNNTSQNHRKGIKVLSFVAAVTLAIGALVLPTTTFAPDLDAAQDSRAASLSVGSLDEFAVIITDNCVLPTTIPFTQISTTVAPTTQKVTEAEKETKATEAQTNATEAKEKDVEAVKIDTAKSTVSNKPVKNEVSEVSETKEVIKKVEPVTEPATENVTNYTSSYLVSISNPDKSYSPSYVTLSAYDRAKLERLVMGEAGTMGYTGCALVAQSIRDAMNRSATSSIDRIISEYKYYAPTTKEPNSDVKNAVSFIFDQNGSAVQHRILCFNAGISSWHETQNFITSCGNVRFYDLWY